MLIHPISQSTGVVQSARQVFNGADGDGSRTIDLREFVAFMQGNGGPATDTQL